MSGGGVIERLTEACAEETGVLMLVNVDNFALFNEIYGIEMGDALLERCVRVINEVTEGDDIKGRLGGDEFIIFCRNLVDKNEVAEMLEYINEKKDMIKVGGIIGVIGLVFGFFWLTKIFPFA